MVISPLSKNSLNNTEVKYFIRALVGQKDSTDEVCNRQSLYAVMLFLDNLELYMDFVTAFAGRTIKVPTRRHINFLLKSASIYDYLQSHNREKTKAKFDLDDGQLDRILNYNMEGPDDGFNSES